MRDRSGTILLIALLAVMTCLPLLRSGYTTSDDVNLALYLQQGYRMSGLVVAEDSGRLQHLLTGTVAPLVYAYGNYWLMKAMGLAGILASIASMFYAVRVVSGSSRFATLAVVLFFAFIQNTQDHNLLTAYPMLSTGALTAFWLAVATWWLALEGRRRLGVVSVVLFVCSLMVYESFLPYCCVFPMLTIIGRPGTWADRVKRAALTPHLLATAVMVVAIVGFRVGFHHDVGREMMQSEQYVLNLDLVRILKVIERYGSSAFPLHYVRVYRPLINDFYMGFGVFRVTLRDIFSVIDVAWIVKGLIVAYCLAMLTLRRDQVQRRGALLFIAVVLIVLTNLPVAVSAKYQNWAIENFSHGYLTSFFVFFGVVILLTITIDGVIGWLWNRSRRAAYVLGWALASVAFVACYTTDLLNAHVAHSQRQMYDRWKTVDQWIASAAFRSIPAGSVILAPSLFEHYPGSVEVFDDYWTGYVEAHGQKKVEVLRDRDRWAARAQLAADRDRVYFLQFMQDRRGDATYLVFARVRPIGNGALMASDDVAVLAHARSDSFRIVGRLIDVSGPCRARLFVNGVPSDGTFTDRFGAHVDVMRNAREWLWVTLAGKGASIAPDSILVTDSNVPVDGSVDVLAGQGFHFDEIAYRWAGDKAVVTLRNLTDRPVQADLMFQVEAPGLQRGATARLQAVAGGVQREWSVGPVYQKYSMRVDIPPTSSLDVLFSTDAPRVNTPTDPRALVLRFHPGMRAREVGCDQTT